MKRFGGWKTNGSVSGRLFVPFRHMARRNSSHENTDFFFLNWSAHVADGTLPWREKMLLPFLSPLTPLTSSRYKNVRRCCKIWEGSECFDNFVLINGVIRELKLEEIEVKLVRYIFFKYPYMSTNLFKSTLIMIQNHSVHRIFKIYIGITIWQN